MKKKPTTIPQLLLTLPARRLRHCDRETLLLMLWLLRDYWPPDLLELLAQVAGQRAE